MIETSTISSQIRDILISQSDEVGYTYLEKWKNQAHYFLTRATLYSKEYAKLQKYISNSVLDETSHLYQEDINLTKMKELLREMYKFLNEVGETLRGEKISYSITLSQGKGKNMEMYTFELSLEQLLDMGIMSTSHTRLTLKRTKTILNQLLQSDKITKSAWASKDIKDYQRFIYNAKRVQCGKWKKVNRGDLLEAYMRYTNLRASNVHIGSTTSALQETLSNNQGFWTGGDIRNIQIKGNTASITNIYTCVNQIQILYTTLCQLDLNSLKEINEKTKELDSSIDSSLEEIKQNTTQEILNQIGKQFNVNIKI